MECFLFVHGDFAWDRSGRVVWAPGRFGYPGSAGYNCEIIFEHDHTWKMLKKKVDIGKAATWVKLGNDIALTAYGTACCELVIFRQYSRLVHLQHFPAL